MGSGKERLRNVLYAVANHDCDVGYTQGMGFIAALLLTLMTEDDAFWSLTALLDQNGKYQLRGLYLDGLPLLLNRHCAHSLTLCLSVRRRHEVMMPLMRSQSGFQSENALKTVYVVG